MYKYVLFIRLILCHGLEINYTNRHLNLLPSYTIPTDPHLYNSTFCPIIIPQHIMSVKIEESTCPWIAQLIHSSVENSPLLCTAVAIDKLLFITAGSCIYSAKVNYTTVIYKSARFRSKAFVLPDTSTKQMFDDVGLIVVHDGTPVEWNFIPIIKTGRNGDNTYKWFQELGINGPTNTVYGYVPNDFNTEVYSLYKQDNVYVSNFICNIITRMKPGTPDYWVPCYHSCTPEEYGNNSAFCVPYLCGAGHAVVDETGTLIGLATWSCDYDPNVAGKLHLPVGFTVPNSDAFSIDRECAYKIRDSNLPPVDGFYDSLCA